jgi:fatty-acyl-CoA synthase
MDNLDRAREFGTIGDILVDAFNRYSERTAFIAGDREISYRQSAAAISQLLQFFDRLGLQRGDTVFQFAHNSPEQWFVTAACYTAGLRSVTLHPNITQVDEQVSVINFSETTCFICDKAFDERVGTFIRQCPNVRFWYAHDPQVADLPCLWEEVQGIEPSSLSNRADPEDIVRLGYTSGTTGPRKGVLLASRAIAALTVIGVAEAEWPDNPRVLCAEPIAGGFGNMVGQTLMRGGTFIMQTRFEPRTFIQDAMRHQPSVLLFMPPALYTLVDDPEIASVSWSFVQLLIYSGANLPARVVRQALAIFGPVLCQVYGQTECPKALAVLRKADHVADDDTIFAALGMPCAGIRVTLLDDEGRECKSGEIGELCVRGPIVTSGYWRDTEATEAAFRGGWWHTGDLCRRDARGYLYFVDRLADTLVRDGRRIYPKVIEDILDEHTAVAESAVVAVRKGTQAATVVVFVVPNGGSIDIRELREFLIEKTGVLLDEVRSVEALPRMPIGRVDKPLLKRRLEWT